MKAVNIEYLTEIDELADLYLALASGTENLYAEFGPVTIVATSGEVLGTLDYSEELEQFLFKPEKV